MQSALSKSCRHRMQESFNYQVCRLLTAGFPSKVVVAVGEPLLQRVKSVARGARTCTQRLKGRPEVMPFVHALSHNLKKVAGRHDVHLVFSAPNKLAKLCPRIGASGQHGCSTKHESPFTIKCSVGVVYSIQSLTCGEVYIRQTERCINERLREHAQKVSKRDDKYAHLVAHVTACGCEARCKETNILGRSKSCTARLALEAFFINTRLSV